MFCIAAKPKILKAAESLILEKQISKLHQSGSQHRI